MGTELVIDDERQDHEDDKTISELKDDVGFADGQVLYTVDGESYPVNDDETVGDIPDGANVVEQPQRGNVFGHHGA